jgi:uncharacterized membrane protein YgdD (TMEM256/DUF423 family)
MAFALVGAVFGMLGVMAGAFGAHALRGTLPPDLLTVFETAARYLLAHGVALVAVSALEPRVPGTGIRLAGWAMAAGVVVFSGSLFALSLSGVRTWGAVTPIGGALMIGGWALLAASVARPGGGRAA